MSSSRPNELKGRLLAPASWSLRARLVALMLTLLALASIGVAGVTEVAAQRTLRHQIDEQLLRADGRTGGAFGDRDRHRPPEEPPETNPSQNPIPGQFIPRGQSSGTIVARVVGDQVQGAWLLAEESKARELIAEHIAEEVPTTASGGGSDILIRIIDASMLAALRTARGPNPQTVALGEGLGEYRTIARTNGDGSVLVTGLPLADVHTALYRIAIAGIGVTLVALLIFGVIAAVLIRRNLRPLDQVAAAASDITELRLHTGEVDLPRHLSVDVDPRTEIGQVGDALNRMLDHLRSALEARHESEQKVRQFVADASHELRTPLAAIRGYAELSRRGDDEVPPQLAHILRRVESEAQRMTGLVEDLLLLARLDAGRPVERGDVDLTALIVDAVSDAHAAGPEHDWRLSLPDEPVVVTGDGLRLHQVVANLLANSRTHTPAGTTVTVGVAAHEDHAELTVVDTGPGIDPDVMPHIFERFARADSSRSRIAGSTGLGLSIVYSVVQAHGGTVTVDSRPGRTAFTVRLPLTAAEELDSAALDSENMV